MLSQGSDGINKMRSDWLRVALLPSEISRSMARSALYGLLGSSGRKRERARARETRKGCLLLARPLFFCAHYFQAPATQAIAVLII